MVDFEDMNLGVQDEGEPIAPEPEVVPEPEVKDQPKPEPEPKPEDEHKKPSGVQRLKAKLQAEREERIRLEERIRAIESRTTPEQPKAAGKPDPNAFENQADYLEALADYKVAERLREAQTQAQEERTKETRKESDKAWQATLNKTHEAHPDLAEMLDDLEGVEVTPTMDSMFRESEHGGDLLYHLASNPEECRRISGLSPTRQAAELGKIEAALAAKGNEKPKPEPKPSRAPAPITPVQPSGAAAPPAGSRYAKFEDF